MRREIVVGLTQRWGQFTVDRMAIARNAELARYNSRHLEVGAEAVDCLAQG